MRVLPLIGLAGLGAVVGSFLNVVADRIPAGHSVLRPPSHCLQCGRRLHALELVPIFSYIALLGRCRTCGAPIPPRVLALEVVCSLSFVAIGASYGIQIHTLLPLLYVSLLLVLAVTDLEHQRIPNAIVLPAILLAALAAPLTPGHGIGELLLGGFVTFAPLFLLATLLPAGMGMGDVKLAAFIGLILGFPAALLVLLLAFIGGGAVAVVLLLTGKIGRSDPMPFGPFLALAGLAGLFWADQLVRLWLGRL